MAKDAAPLQTVKLVSSVAPDNEGENPSFGSTRSSWWNTAAAVRPKMTDMSSAELDELDEAFKVTLGDVHFNERKNYLSDDKIRSMAISDLISIYTSNYFTDAAAFIKKRFGPVRRPDSDEDRRGNYSDDGDGYHYPTPGYRYDNDVPLREYGYYAGGEWVDYNESYGDY